jgi:hypothetical protein
MNTMKFVQVQDPAVRRERRSDVGDATEHAVATEAAVEHVHVRDTVQ